MYVLKWKKTDLLHRIIYHISLEPYASHTSTSQSKSPLVNLKGCNERNFLIFAANPADKTTNNANGCYRHTHFSLLVALPRCPTATMLRPPLHVSLLSLSKLSRPSLPDNSWCKAATTAPRRCCHCPALLYLHCMLPAIDCCLLNGSLLQDNSCNATAPQWHGYHRSASLLACLLPF